MKAHRVDYKFTACAEESSLQEKGATRKQKINNTPLESSETS
jgi:hypothetical protein